MNALDLQSIGNKLTRLRGVVRELEEIRKTSEKVFVLDARLQAATERFMTLGIEIITDIGNHLLSEKSGRAATSYEDIIDQLGKNKLVPEVLSERNKGMADFRNLIIHAYDVVDPKRVFDYLQKAPEEFHAFAKAFAKFL